MTQINSEIKQTNDKDMLVINRKHRTIVSVKPRSHRARRRAVDIYAATGAVVDGRGTASKSQTLADSQCRRTS